MHKLQQTFKKLAQRHGGETITIEEALIIAKVLSEDPMFAEEELINIVGSEDTEKNRLINEEDFKKLVEEIKRRQNQQNEADTVLAYVAMGGQQDRGGFVDANKLIKIVKDDFEMTIDIEKLIQEIDEDGSGAIEYGEFNTLLNSS